MNLRVIVLDAALPSPPIGWFGRRQIDADTKGTLATTARTLADAIARPAQPPRVQSGRQW